MALSVYPNGARKALVLSFDDGEIQDRALAASLRGLGLKGTFFLCSAHLGLRGPLIRDGEPNEYIKVEAHELKSVYQDHEIGAHGAHHRGFTRLSEEELAEEILGDLEVFSSLGVPKPIGGAYPGGHYTLEAAENLGRLGLVYARTTQCTESFLAPSNFLTWHPTCHMYYPGLEALIERFLNLDEQELSLFHIYGHSYELDKKGIDGWGYMEGILTRLSGREDVWYATLGDYYRFMKSGTNE